MVFVLKGGVKMTQTPLHKCIIKHGKVVYKYYIAAIAVILFIIGVIFAYGLIKDTFVSTLSLIVTRFLDAITSINVCITSIISMIPTLVYLIGMLIFGPLILVLVYCVWMQLTTKNAKDKFSLIGILFTITLYLTTLYHVRGSYLSLSMYEVYLVVVMVIFYSTMFLLCSVMLSKPDATNDGEA